MVSMEILFKKSWNMVHEENIKLQFHERMDTSKNIIV